MDKYELSFNEWHEKTNWVQDDKRFDVLLPWGKHRADVMKEYIDLLESRVAGMAVQLANAESKFMELSSKAIELVSEASLVYSKYNDTQLPYRDLVDMQTLQEMHDLCKGAAL